MIRAANALHDQALQQQLRGRPGRALVLCRHALGFVERVSGPASVDAANVGNTLAAIHAELGDLTEAERLFRRSVEITELAATDRDTHIVHIQSVDGLAGVLRVAARYAEAEPLYRRALAHAERQLGGVRAGLVISQKLFDPGDPAMATLHHNLGGLDHARGRYVEGEPSARRSVAIREGCARCRSHRGRRRSRCACRDPAQGGGVAAEIEAHPWLGPLGMLAVQSRPFVDQDLAAMTWPGVGLIGNPHFESSMALRR